MKRIYFTYFFLISFFTLLTFTQSLFAQNVAFVKEVDYPLPWPGILPDSKVYKLKVLRNKIIEKMIIDPVKKVEFDLLMADKTIYASKLLAEKGKMELALETALKGEHYYSLLVQNYNKALLAGKKIPNILDGKITLAAVRHQEIFEKLENKAKGEQKKTFQIVNNFSKINYDFIVRLRNPKEINEK